MSDATGFRNLRFPDTISWGSTGGEAFQVQIQSTGSGYEFRQADWDEARNEWDVAQRVRTQLEQDKVTAFFRTNRGMAFSWRWKAWDDYKVSAIEGVTERHADNPLAYLMYKRYTDYLAFVDRRIVLPIDYDDTAMFKVADRKVPQIVYRDGTPMTSDKYAVDFRNGVIWLVPTVDYTSTAIAATATGNWYVSTGPDFSDFVVGDKIVVSGFDAAGDNCDAAHFRTITTVDGGGNRIQVADTLTTEAAGNVIHIVALPATTEDITWQGEFDVPARFNMRQLKKTIVDYNYYSFEEVAVIEVLPDEIVEDDFITGGPPA